MPRVRKAVFPVAGLGTRFLPATKAVPKEMLTIVDRPLIQYAVEECRAAGIEISRRMIDGERSAEVIREKLRDYREVRGKRLAPADAQAIEIALDPSLKPPTQSASSM